jgi:hypothetical protein
MTQDEIIEMANEAGIIQPRNVIKTLEAFAKLVAQYEGKKYEDIITNMAKLLEMQQKREGVAVDMIEAAVLAEREECAKIADQYVGQDLEHNFSALVAHNIRARGQA